MAQPKQTWIEKAKDTYKFHRQKLLSHDKWRAQDTAKALKRSLGSICEDLMIARWAKTHEKELDKFDFAYEALEWIRKKQKEMDADEIK